jgi:peptidoglycan/xylan/chitin deacetylase (PgdA/CDA1 family)
MASKQPSKNISRRKFIRAAGIGLAGAAGAACQPIVVRVPQSDSKISATQIPATATPAPSPTPFTPTPTFETGQLDYLLTQDEIDFIAAHEVKEGDTSRPVVMMTYDDNAKYAQVRTILDAFNHYNLKASFFFIGEKMPLSAKAVRAIVEDGHLLCCHGWEHIYLLNLNKDQVNRQLENCFKAVDEIVPGYRLRFIRFPYGAGVGNDWLLNIAASWGLQHVHWTMGSGGLEKNTHDNVLRNVSNGAIVLSHMFRKYDIEQAEDIIVSLLEKGYSIETLETGRKPEDMYERKLIQDSLNK